MTENAPGVFMFKWQLDIIKKQASLSQSMIHGTLYLTLNLKQHGLELHGSNSMQFFFTTTVLHDIWATFVESMWNFRYTELGIQREDYELYTPNPCHVQGSTVVPQDINSYCMEKFPGPLSLGNYIQHSWKRISFLSTSSELLLILLCTGNI